jgi:glyoxylase-like metal-dependent hydrolase (beta-lactamase superfamily II)
MIYKKNKNARRSGGNPCNITRERLKGTDADLTSFHFLHGGNIYVFSYKKGGRRTHTFIDTGDFRYRDQIVPILTENGIDPSNIERIIISHRHPDHCGLAEILAKQSKAKILVHSNFRDFVEGELDERERLWSGCFDPSRLKECDVEYLTPSNNKVVKIGGLDFPILSEPIEIGGDGRLQMLACPENTPTHTPDQVIVLYSHGNPPQTSGGKHDGFRPTDDMLFTGDLWLMTGPVFDRRMMDISLFVRIILYLAKCVLTGQRLHKFDPAVQDVNVKDALKRAFLMIRIKPGHGEEFIASRIIPGSLFAERDLLEELGYPLETDISILKRSDLASKIAAKMDNAYTSFMQELFLWKDMDYTLREISEILIRIYKEQRGGSSQVARDRSQRRESLKSILVRLRTEQAASSELHQLADSTLLELARIS